VVLVDGTFDKFKGRRITFEKCYWWESNPAIKDKSKLVTETKPKGRFSAKKITPKDNTSVNIDNSFLIDRIVVTLLTYDYISIKKNDIVKFDNDLWRVENIQSVEEEKQEQFRKVISKTSYLRLVK
jgi:hypothetical protein